MLWHFFILFCLLLSKNKVYSSQFGYIFLKDDPSTNAGHGSNLTEDGHVECDASIMDGHSGAFAAVGAVPGI